MMFFWILIPIAIIIAIWFFKNNPNNLSDVLGKKEGDSPMEILKQKLVNGEITIEEFEQKKAILDNTN